MTAPPALPAIDLEPHPLLEAGLLAIDHRVRLGELSSPDWLRELLTPCADAPFAASQEIRDAVRALLRHGGYKPAGRGKPASEYLVRAATGDGVRSINTAVDLCNAVSLHSGLPISVVDLGRTTHPLRIAIAADDAAYVFNPAGQEIRLAGLPCLHDERGPCANAVKDAQRTKTDETTTATLSVIWGTRALDGLASRAMEWYSSLARRAGASVVTGLAVAPR